MYNQRGPSALEKFLAFILILMILGVGYLVISTYLLNDQVSVISLPFISAPSVESTGTAESESSLSQMSTSEKTSAEGTLPDSGETHRPVPAGIHLVGEEGIHPGIYQGLAGDGLFDSCYWSRLGDLDQTPESILANDNGLGQYYVEILAGDHALETLCELTPLASAAVLEIGEELPVGTYIVGRDIQPGSYQGQAGAEEFESCYWALLSDLTGSAESISAEEHATGSYQVEVLESNYALKTACPLTRISE